jgi:hypothetical protein
MSRSIQSRPQVPDVLVEKVHLGEASDAERAQVLGDPDAKARLDALPSLNAAFLAQYPIDEEVRRIEGRARLQDARTGASNRSRLFAVLLAPTLAAGLAFLWVGIANDQPVGHGTDLTTPKGLAPKLRLYRERAQGIERLNAGVVARKGDRLQVGVVSGDSQHGVVVSIDGRGNVTLHWPVTADGATDLAPGELSVPKTYTLDDAPDYERFFLVTTGEKPTDVSTVVHAAEALAESGDARTEPLAVPHAYNQSSFLVRKETQNGAGGVP